MRPNLYIRSAHLPLPDTTSLLGRVLNEELPHQPGYGVPVGLQGEVPGVEQVVFKRLQVSLVWLGSGGGEDLVVLAPNDQQRRLVLAEILLPFRVQRRVTAVAEEQVELDFIVPLAVKQELVVGRAVWADEFWRLHAVRVLPFGRVLREQPAERIPLRLVARFFPIRLDRLPEVVVQALIVGVAVLDHDRRDTRRVDEGNLHVRICGGIGMVTTDSTWTLRRVLAQLSRWYHLVSAPTAARPGGAEGWRLIDLRHYILDPRELV